MAGSVINSVGRATYKMSSGFRARTNGCPLYEPAAMILRGVIPNSPSTGFLTLAPCRDRLQGFQQDCRIERFFNNDAVFEPCGKMLAPVSR